MTRLIRAGFRRYFKSAEFFITLAALVLLGGFGAAETGPHASPDDIYLVALMLGFAAMTALSVGRELGGGAVRNKIAYGYTKGQIFLSEMTVAFAICSAILAVSAVPFLLLDHDILSTIPIDAVIKTVTGLVMLNLAVTALCVTVCLLVPNKALSAVMAIVLVIAIMLAGYLLYGELERPKYLDEHVTMDGEYLSEGNTMPNPRYPDGAKRAVFQFLYNANPFGQIIEYSEILSPYFTPHTVSVISKGQERTLNTAPLYSLGVIIAVSGGGYILFRKKNLK